MGALSRHHGQGPARPGERNGLSVTLSGRMTAPCRQKEPESTVDETVSQGGSGFCTPAAQRSLGSVAMDAVTAVAASPGWLRRGFRCAPGQVTVPLVHVRRYPSV